MRVLRSCPRFPGLPNVQPGLRVLRGSVDPAPRQYGDRLGGVPGPQARSAGGLDGPRPQRDRAAGLGQRINGDWPGALYGVRAPDPQETPLSWAEVHFLRGLK